MWRTPSNGAKSYLALSPRLLEVVWVTRSLTIDCCYGPQSLAESRATRESEPRPSSEQICKQLIFLKRDLPLRMTLLQASPPAQPTFDSSTSGWQLRDDFLSTGLNRLELRQAGDRSQVASTEKRACQWRLSLVLSTVDEWLPPIFSPLVGSGDTCSSTQPGLQSPARSQPTSHCWLNWRFTNFKLLLYLSYYSKYILIYYTINTRIWFSS